MSIQKQKIVFILSSLNAGGAERVLITLMNNLNRNKYEPYFIVISGDGPLKSLISDDVHFFDLKCRNFYFSIFKLLKTLRLIDPHIVCSTMVQTNTLSLLLKPFFSNAKFIIREANMPSALASKQYGLKGIMCFLSYRFVYPHADLVLSPSRRIIAEFRSIFSMDTSKHRRLLNPLDVDRIEGFLTRKRETLKKHKTYFIAVGRLRYEKGFDLLINSLKDFTPSYDWELKIFGEGSQHDLLQSLIYKNKLQNKITLCNFTDNPWEEMFKADYMLLPSRWEGLPNVAIESLYCGTPVISTKKAGGIREIAEGCDNSQVTICENVDKMIDVMHGLKPKSAANSLKSFLPEQFLLSDVMLQFEKHLEFKG